MKNNNLIVMLTNNDLTVMDAGEIFEKCKDSKAEFWGMKEVPLPLPDMKQLYAQMKLYEKTTFLEIVEYEEEKGLEGAKLAVECGCDILMGTVFFDSIHQYCMEHHVKYMPFVGTIEGRPSVLSGSIDNMICEARQYLEKGVYGIDLLGYRYTQNPVELNSKFMETIDAPVCIAGSINSYQRLDEIKAVSPWAYTIGSAFFNHKFGFSITEQIDKVCEYMER